MIRRHAKKLVIVALLIALGLVLEILGLLDARQLLAIAQGYAQYWWLIPVLILAQTILFTFALAGSPSTSSCSETTPPFVWRWKSWRSGIRATSWRSTNGFSPVTSDVIRLFRKIIATLARRGEGLAHTADADDFQGGSTARRRGPSDREEGEAAAWATS